MMMLMMIILVRMRVATSHFSYGREVMVRVLSVGPEKAWVIRKEKHRAVVLLEKLRPFEAANV